MVGAFFRCFVNWLVRWFFVVWLVGWLIGGSLVGWLMVRSLVRFWSVGCMFGRFVVSLIGSFFRFFVNRSVRSFVGWFFLSFFRQ